MKKHVYFLSSLIIIAFSFFSCQKKTESAPDSVLTDYMQLETGKYIRYRLDSTLYVNFGQKDTTIYYQAKDVVEGEITDNNGKPGFRIVRYLRDTASTNEADWKPTLTYSVNTSRESIEVSENNLKFQKLRIPVKNGYNWHGNTYLPSTPFYDLYQFSNDEDIDVWDYTYQDVDQSTMINDKVYDNTISVLQIADSSNVPISFPDGLAYRNYWIEQYGKNIGLIYKEIAMWEYQPPNAGNPGFISGFGLKMTIIDHN
ncbi:MAG: hypothetical protein ABI687_09565 [Flavitalea sp.]